MVGAKMVIAAHLEPIISTEGRDLQPSRGVRFLPAVEMTVGTQITVGRQITVARQITLVPVTRRTWPLLKISPLKLQS